jgi:hypothetical protein
MIPVPAIFGACFGDSQNPPPRRIGRAVWEASQGGGCVVGWVLLVVVIVVVRALSSSSSSSSPGPTLSYTNSLQYLYTTPSPETKSLTLLLHEHTIHSCILMHFISHWASFFLKIYLSIYLSSAFFAFLLWVFDPRSSICILVQI